MEEIHVKNKHKEVDNGAEIICITLDGSGDVSSLEESNVPSDDEDEYGQCQKQGSECPAGTNPEDPDHYLADDNYQEMGVIQTPRGGPEVTSHFEEIEANTKIHGEYYAPKGPIAYRDEDSTIECVQKQRETPESFLRRAVMKAKDAVEENWKDTPPAREQTGDSNNNTPRPRCRRREGRQLEGKPSEREMDEDKEI